MYLLTGKEKSISVKDKNLFAEVLFVPLIELFNKQV